MPNASPIESLATVWPRRDTSRLRVTDTIPRNFAGDMPGDAPPPA